MKYEYFYKPLNIKVEVQVKLNQRRTYLHLKPHLLKITTFKKLDKNEIEFFIQQYEKKIREVCLKEENYDFNTLHLWGKKYCFYPFIDNKIRKTEVEIKENIILIRASSEEKIKKAIKTMYNNELKARYLPYYQKVEKLFNERFNRKIENKFKGINYYKSFLGRCYFRTKEIELSSYLAKYDEDIMYEVICHEFCHLFYSDHGPNFKKLLYSLVPNYSEYKKRIKIANHEIIKDYI